MKTHFVVCLWLFVQKAVAVDITLGAKTQRESRKLFGGYRITPRFCKPTRPLTPSLGGPSICMFNHECLQRNGQVVGACMDGFLFGACCQLPTDSQGELIESDISPVSTPANDLTPTLPPVDIMSDGVSQIAQSLLNPASSSTIDNNNVLLQIDGEVPLFTKTGVTHSTPETLILNGISNTIHASDFKIGTTKNPVVENRRTTIRVEDTTVPYFDPPTIHISISNKPSTKPKPIFRPRPTKPTDDKYILVPTISYLPPNKTMEVDSIVNILQMLNSTRSATTSKKPPSTSYVFSSTSTRRPTISTTTKKPPSTSYVFSTTLKPRRTTSAITTTTKKKTKPSKKKNTTARPAGFSTYGNSPSAFITSTKPPSTSYVYSSIPTRRPPSIVNTHIAGPGFSVTSSPGQYSSYPSPAPTLIVLGPSLADEEVITKRPYDELSPTRPSYPRPASIKPINSVTINNHVTQNIYSTSERPQPTVLITPKPAISTSSYYDLGGISVEAATNSDQLINFPPVRNPNLNMTSSFGEDDITTPGFVEDDALNDKVESFVNKIIQGLQEPFEGLKGVVMKNGTGSTTKKPVKKEGATTKRPTTVRRTTTRRTTTRRPSTKRTTTVITTKRPTGRPATTTTQLTFIEEDNVVPNSDNYRDQCGIRPLLKTGRIVGGKGATFGEFPWQVLVRESTWLGLFTKNKCGGVLISNKYVMTAAHCQPGFLASLVAVFGEFDISGDLESRRPISRNVRRVIVHRKYDPATFENDLALLELESPVKFDAHIIPICLPRDGEDFTGRMATVTGWGRLKYGGGVPSVLQEVQVPIMENPVCQEMFRTAGHSKVILESFLCAGYANGQKDSCEGDSGGPLVLQRADGRYQLAGTVSHGIKCAAPYLPGVYMRTTFFKPWITAITGIE